MKTDRYVGRVNADLKYLPFASPTFDFVVVSGFLHHVASERDGYGPYLKTLGAVLKPGGWMVVLEPSCFFPFCWLTTPLRNIFGEITGQVPHERPVNPIAVRRCLKRIGLTRVFVRAASFSHPRFFLPVAKALGAIQDYVARVPLIRNCGFFVLLAGQKA